MSSTLCSTRCIAAKAVDVSAGDGTRSPRPSSTPTTSWFGNPLSALAGIGEVSALESFNQ